MNKSIYFKALCLAAALFGVVFGAQAQDVKKETSIIFGGLLPTGQFNDAVVTKTHTALIPMDLTNIAMGANVGLSASARFGLWFNIGVGELQPFAEGSFVWNTSNSTIRNDYESNSTNELMGEAARYPQYINVPVLLGLKYRRLDVIENIHPYFEMALGYDLLLITSSGYSNQLYSYKPSGALAWMLGLGTYLGQYVSVGFTYMGLGSHRIDYTDKSTTHIGYSSSNLPRRNLGEFGIRVGFHF